MPIVQASAFEQIFNTLKVIQVSPAGLTCKFRCHHGSRCYRLDMQPFAIPHPRFNRVSESVAQVEQCALAAFMLIGNDNFSLVCTRAADGILQCPWLSFQQAFEIGFKPDQKR